LGCRDDDVIDRAATAEQVCDAVVVGHIRWNRDRIQLFRDRIQPRDIARGNDDGGPFRLANSALRAQCRTSHRPPRLSCLQAACAFPQIFLLLCGDDQVGSNCMPMPGLLRPSPGSSQTPAPEGLMSAAISTSIR